MSSNKHVKDKMIKIFGKKCFIEELHLRKPEEIEQDKRRYTGKCQRCIMDQLTYHHILERCKGGKATIENGALLRNINHQWFHRLSKEQQAKINELFQEYKQLFYDEAKVEFVDDLDLSIEIDFAIIEATKQGLKTKKKGSYNRAEMKRETKRLEKEYEEGCYER